MSAALKTALVTGATRGIGRAIAEALLAQGRRVIACGRDARALAELAQRQPGRVSTLPVDLAEPGAPDRVVDQALRLASRIDELVCAAGIVHYAGIGGVSERDLRAQLELNFLAPFLLTQRLGTHMRDHGQGAVVLLASTLGQRPAPQTAAYAASKAALISATRSFALELAPAVRVNAIAPGVVDTDMVRVVRASATPNVSATDVGDRVQTVAQQLEQLRRLHPLGRLGTPEDVAQGALYLLDAPWITGSVLTLDGGLSIA